MSIIVNGTELGSQISLDNTDLSEIIFNGVSVWKSRIMLKKLPYDFSSGSAVVLNGEIHILGGYGTSNKTKHYKYNGSDWVSVSTLPYEFNKSNAVVLNNEIHILGGAGNNSKNHYKWNGSQWVSVSTLPYEYITGVAVVLNDEIHILGSEYYTGTPPSQTYTHATKHYAWNGSSWSSKSTLFYGGIKYQSIGVVYNNQIHIFDRSSVVITSKHYIWNGGSSSSSWQQSTALQSFDAYSAQVVVYDNKIHLLGGLNSETAHYTWNGTSYSQLSDLPYDFSFGSAVVCNNETEIAILGTNETNYKTYDAQWDGTSWTIGAD